MGGMLNVAAEDKGTGSVEKITITNDKGRLSEEQIEKMIREAEEFADEDRITKEKVDARNAFDNYLHSMRTAIDGQGDNPGLGEKMDEDEKESVMDAIKDGSDWPPPTPTMMTMTRLTMSSKYLILAGMMYKFCDRRKDASH